MKQLKKKEAYINYEIAQLEHMEDNYLTYKKFAIPFLKNMVRCYNSSSFQGEKIYILVQFSLKN
jgi:hypothetical protein